MFIFLILTFQKYNIMITENKKEMQLSKWRKMSTEKQKQNNNNNKNCSVFQLLR